jgi:hypothetical protein
VQGRSGGVNEETLQDAFRSFSRRAGEELLCWGETVASYHCGDGCGVGQATGCGLKDTGHLAEVVRAEDAGG